MKKIFLIILVAASAVACKKDGSGSGKKLLLSKIFFNGLLNTEYIYNIDGKITRVNNYLNGGGQSTLTSYFIYQYNSEGRISESILYSDEHSGISRGVYSYNAQGKLTRIDESVSYDGDQDLDILDFYKVFSYNAGGQLTKMTRREHNNTMDYYTDYAYDDKGYLKSYETWYLDNGNMVIKQKMEMNPGAKPMPEHWKAMLHTPIDWDLYRFYITGLTFTSYWSGPAGDIILWSFHDREYNDQGYVVKEIWKQDAYGSVNENERTFEYVQQ